MDEDDLSDLKDSLKRLHSWVLEGDDLDLDDVKKREIKAVQAQLKILKTRSAPVFALPWSSGELLLAKIKKETVSSSTLQVILTTFVESLRSSNLKQILDDICLLWTVIGDDAKGLIKFSPQGCLYKTFLHNCLQNMRHPDICPVMVEIVKASCAPCLLRLVNRPQQRDNLYKILDVLLIQLVEPFSVEAQDTAKYLLNTCGWKIADALREMLNGVLNVEEDTFNPCTSYEDVYKIIFELILINKDLVLGLINNTELCLASGRDDRMKGLEFFCKLFGAKRIPGIPKPAELYSHLWGTFLNHCRNTSLVEPRELLCLAKYTPDILRQSDTHDGWCSLLFFLFQYHLSKKCDAALVAGITTAVKENVSLLLKTGSKSLSQLIKNFLDPQSVYGRADEILLRLMKDLGDIYLDVTKSGIVNMNLPNIRETSSWLLSCLLQPCSTLSPQSEKWCFLRKIFMRKLVPHHVADEDRMKMFLYLFLNTNFEDWSILHELFLKTVQTRQLILSIMHHIRKNETPQTDKSHLKKQIFQLSKLLIGGSPVQFLMKQFFPKLASTPDAAELLWNLACCKNSCSENFQNTARLKVLLLAGNNMDEKVLDGLLFYLCEVTFDTASVKHLIELVDSCVMGKAISSAIGENRLHIARTALRLFSEALFLVPKIGLDFDVLSYILKWSKLSNGSLSMLALRCFTYLPSFHSVNLGANSEYLKEQLLLVWFHIIGCGSRGQVKTAIKCVAHHSSSSQDENLIQVFHMISNDLNNPDDGESFERGVSALGHFASVCPSALKEHVEQCCMSVLLKGVIVSSLLQNTSSCAESVISVSSNNTWVDWQELPHHISIKVQALRSIGRCMRYCGSMKGVSMALKCFHIILSNSGDFKSQLREVDKDRLRCEAASAVLHIFEADRFHSVLSKGMLMSLAHVMTDPRVEVRTIFAEKLVQGLCVHKIRACKVGRSRGSLPSCMLGLLSLLGSDVWTETPESEAFAQTLLKEVFVSRHLAVKMQAYPMTMGQLYEKCPHLVLERIFVAAVPIIAEHNLFQSWSFNDESVWKENVDVVLRVFKCFEFIQGMLCHPETFGGQVSELYLQSMCYKARQSLPSSMEPAMTKKYAVVIELLEIALRRFKTVSNPLTPPVKLPPPFFVEVQCEDTSDPVRFFSEAESSEIVKYLLATKKRKRQQVTSNQHPEEDTVDFNEVEPCSEEDSSLNSSLGQSLDGQILSPPREESSFTPGHMDSFLGEPPAQSTPLIAAVPRKRMRIFSAVDQN